MRLMASGIIVAALALVATPALACNNYGDETYFRSGYATGETFAKVNDLYLQHYVVGALDALTAAPLLGGEPDCVNRAYACIEGRSAVQQTAIFRKYLNDNPDKWNWSANILVFNAILAPCMKQPQ